MKNIQGIQVVGEITGPTHLKTRLFELGFLKGIQIEVMQKIPMDGPFIVRLGNSLFALRNEEIQMLDLKNYSKNV